MTTVSEKSSEKTYLDHSFPFIDLFLVSIEALRDAVILETKT